MDMISQLSDDLILRILSRLPRKDVLATSLVSKRWVSLWSLVSRLKYNDSNYENYDDDVNYDKFTQFVYRDLLSNKSHVLESLKLNFGANCKAVDIRIWIETAVSHHVRDLQVFIRSCSSTVSLPSSLFTCETLENLHLVNCVILMDYHRDDIPCYLPSLETMFVSNVPRYASYLPRLLPCCPKLDFLVLCTSQCYDQKHINEEDMIVLAVPWLKRLCIKDYRKRSTICGRVFKIDTPSLVILKIVDDVFYDSRQIENMPNLYKAHVDIIQGVTHKFLRALSCAHRLYLCFPLLSEAPSMNIFFYRLVHLEINTCNQDWWDLLSYMLQNSPELESLKLTNEHEDEIPRKETPVGLWKPPCCISAGLESFEWSDYKGRRGDLEVAAYVLQYSIGLKTASFYLTPSSDYAAKNKMSIDLLGSLTINSISLELVFYDQNF